MTKKEYVAHASQIDDKGKIDEIKEIDIIFISTSDALENEDRAKNIIKIYSEKLYMPVAIDLRGKLKYSEMDYMDNMGLMEEVKQLFGEEKRSIIIDKKINAKQVSYLTCAGLDKIYLQTKYVNATKCRVVEHWPEWY